MTFVSETVRILFHQLPTAKQVEYAEWEDRLAIRQQRLQIEGVMHYGTISEVVIRITDQLDTLIGVDSNTPKAD